MTADEDYQITVIYGRKVAKKSESKNCSDCRRRRRRRLGFGFCSVKSSTIVTIGSCGFLSVDKNKIDWMDFGLLFVLPVRDEILTCTYIRDTRYMVCWYVRSHTHQILSQDSSVNQSSIIF